MTTKAHAIDDEAPPVPPIRPDNLACCDTGCIPCVFDVYEERVDDYREALRAWRERHGAAPRGERGVNVLSTLDVMGAISRLCAMYESPGGDVPKTDFAPTDALIRRILGGGLADVAILTKEAVHQLMVDGLLLAGSRVDFAMQQVGVITFSGAVLTHSLRHEEARRLLRFLSSTDAIPVLQAEGLEPAGPS